MVQILVLHFGQHVSPLFSCRPIGYEKTGARTRINLSSPIYQVNSLESSPVHEPITTYLMAPHMYTLVQTTIYIMAATATETLQLYA